MNLKDLAVDVKTSWIDFPGCDGFEVEVANLSRKELIGLRKRCTVQKFDRKSRQIVESLDDDKFVKEFTNATLKNWKGLTLGKLEGLMLINMEGQDPEAELKYSKENAEILVTSSSEFDNWLNTVCFELENFRSKGTGVSLGAPE